MEQQQAPIPPQPQYQYPPGYPVAYPPTQQYPAQQYAPGSPPFYPPGYAQQLPQTSGLAVASLVMGVVAWFLLPGIGGVLAIVFGVSSLNNIKRSQGYVTGKGMAVSGVILGVLHLVIALVIVFAILAAIGAAGAATGR